MSTMLKGKEQFTYTYTIDRESSVFWKLCIVVNKEIKDLEQWNIQKTSEVHDQF